MWLCVQRWHRVLAIGALPNLVCIRLPFVQASLAGFDRLCVGFASLAFYLRNEFRFAHSDFAFRLRLHCSSVSVWLRFPQPFEWASFSSFTSPFSFAFSSFQASPSISVCQSSVPSDFASLANLSGLGSLA